MRQPFCNQIVKKSFHYLEMRFSYNKETDMKEFIMLLVVMKLYKHFLYQGHLTRNSL